MKKSILILILISGIFISFISSCNKDETPDEVIQNDNRLATLSTLAVSSITSTTVNSGGNITSDGDSPITSKGVCWNTTINPTIENSITLDGTGIDNFSSDIEGLSPNTKYYVRAYVTNSAGTAYGNEISFTTVDDGSNIIPQFDILKVIDGKEFRKIIKTSDGGYVGIAYADDYNIIKFDAYFNIIWNKTYGGPGQDYAESISQTSDGSYLVLGYSNSIDGDITGNHGENDIWAIKIDGSGNLLWEKSYGGSSSDGLNKNKSVLLTNDGGFMFIGHTKSNDGDVSENKGGYEVWIVKANSAGEIQFEKTLGGTQDDYGRSIIQTSSSYSVLIKSNSSDGDFNSAGNWIVQIDPNGEIIWKTNLSGLNSGVISKASDNNIIVVNNSADQYLISKLDFNGNVIMSNIIDFKSTSAKQPSTRTIQETSDKGFIITGNLGNGNDADALLFRVSPELNLLYSKIYEGNNMDFSASLIPLNENNYLYQFSTLSDDINGVEYSSHKASVIVKLEEILN